ncbi:MAG: AmmeMemoRadiSam system radical SAM enzyme [Candidatus Diapherotrites archaeon]|nr:AmmeMemoRadiSam system radical SAM enzyme [Candidatus Diapherotrites archaeon]
MKEARFYKKLPQAFVQCTACNRFCRIANNSTGFCRVRKNVNGTLYSLVYNKTLTLTADPIEKKPLFHFMPGTYCNSISTYGCNFSCPFCQNHDISQDFTEKDIEAVQETTPEQIVENTIERGLEGIAYTYVEPTVFIEYAIDTMKLAKKEKLYNVWVSNGYMSEQAIGKLAKYLDAANIDLKGDAKFYKKLCGNVNVELVKKSIQLLYKKRVHVEVTNLIVPGYNDNADQIREVASFVASIDKGMVLHFSRFFPHYKMLDTPVTPLTTLRQAYSIAKQQGLHHVYLGNVPEAQNTYCPKCGSLVIEREGYTVMLLALDKRGRCKHCGYDLGIKVRESQRTSI